MPQPPQFEFVFRFVSQPFEYIPSQLSNPFAHERTTQLLLTQAAVPLETKHAMPQPPQLFTSFVVVVSQPLPELPSQSPLPDAHIDTPHMLFTHAGVPPWGGHTLLHVEQLLTLFVVLISQPFVTLLSQLAYPILQVIEHMPPEHDGMPLFVLQPAPQAPQCRALVFRFVSHPFAAIPSQSPKPVLQLAMVQLPFEQPAVAFASMQTVPHMLQLFTFVLTFVSQPSDATRLQSAKGGAHASTLQLPIWHFVDAFGSEQTVSHVPQFCASVCVLISQPSLATLLQFEKPASQLATPHTPPWQTSFEFARTHTLLQTEQWAAVVITSISQPFCGSKSQSANVPVQAPSAHMPAAHAGSAFGNGAQGMPQALQFDGSSSGFDSQPLTAVISQSFHPWSQLVSVQIPSMHSPEALAGSHGTPHAPQWTGSVNTSTHAPSQHDAPTWQSCFGVQPGTHFVEATSQIWPGGQGSSAMHPMHVCVGVSHVIIEVPSPNWLQSASSLHPGTHVLSASQYWPSAQTSFVGKHATHVFVLPSHNGLVGDPAQSAPSVHPSTHVLSAAQ
jgi:hypothetical protein